MARGRSYTSNESSFEVEEAEEAVVTIVRRLEMHVEVVRDER